MNQKIVKTNSPAKTQKVAQDLAKTLKGGDVVALFGDLGAGKTVFVKGLAAALGIRAKITSPTFVFMKSYPVGKKKKSLNFYHIDLYRTTSAKDIESLGLAEIFSKGSIVVIEWADRLKTQPAGTTEVFIEKNGEKERSIKIKRN